MKKLFTMILSILLLSTLSVNLVGCNNEEAKYPTASKNLTFELTEDESGYILKSSVDCLDENLVIPATYENKPVLEIGEYSFRDRTDIKSVVIPQSVKVVKSGAFYDCSNLEKIVFWNNSKLEEIQYDAFAKTKIQSITIPKSVKVIGMYAFSYCEELKTLKFEKNSQLTNIADNAFYSCDILQNFTLPDGLTYIGEDAFASCESITTLNIPKTVLSIGEGAFRSCGELTSVNFLGDDKIIYIERETFSFCSKLTTVNIPKSVVEIRYKAFSSCGFTEISIPENVELVAGFSYCSNLTTANFLGNNLKTLTREAFPYCSNFEIINYAGTESDWAKIDRQGGDMWHYNSKQLVINYLG